MIKKKNYYYYNRTYYNYGNSNNDSNNNDRSKRRRISDNDKFDINGSTTAPQSLTMITPLTAIIKDTIEQVQLI